MANKTLQLLRNASVFTAQANPAKSAHDVAIEALQTQLAAAKDGEVILARYEDGSDIRTLLGVAYKPAEGPNKYEIFDNQGGNDAIEHAIAALVNGATGNYATLGGIQGIIDAMEEDEGGSDGDVIVHVVQTDGTVTATKASLSDVKLAGYALNSAKTGAIAATDTVEDALSKIENAIAKNTAASADGSVTITQPTSGASNGKTDFAVNVDGTTIVKNNGALKANLEVTQLTSTEISALSDENVKEAYKLIYNGDANRTAIGDVVKIYKDSSLYSVYLGTTGDTITSPTDPTVVPGSGSEALCFIYQKANGTYELVAVDVEAFLQESEFSNGLQVVNHVVSVLKDATSGKVRISATPDGVTPKSEQDTGWVDVITVSSDGVKINNIDEAITYALQNATAELAISAQGDNYITAAVDAQNNKKINVTADVQQLTASAGTRGTYTVADNGTVTLAGEVAPSISGTADSLVDGSDAATKVKTYVDAAVAAEAAARGAYIEGAVKALDSSVSATAADGNKYSVLTGVTEVDGKLTAKTEVKLETVAKTGAAADVAITDAGGYFATDTVESALQDLAAFDCGTY